MALRIRYFDIAKGIAIICVIVGHSVLICVLASLCGGVLGLGVFAGAFSCAGMRGAFAC